MADCKHDALYTNMTQMGRWLHYSNNAEDCDGAVVSRDRGQSIPHHYESGMKSHCKKIRPCPCCSCSTLCSSVLAWPLFSERMYQGGNSSAKWEE